MSKTRPTINFTDNPAVASRGQNFVTVTVDLPPVLASWRESLFAHEWLHPDGSLKQIKDQNEAVRQRRTDTEAKINQAQALERPVLGIGILDNIEIGAGRDTLLTIASLGYSRASVHIPKSHLDEFKLFIRD